MIRRTAARPTRPTLMPLVVLLALSMLATLPLLSSLHAYAAAPQRFETLTVHPGETLWSIAAQRTPAGGNVEDEIDRIVAANRLAGGAVHPGQRLRVPE